MLQGRTEKSELFS